MKLPNPAVLHIFMLLYNVTYNVELSVADDWHNWLTLVHIPKVLGTGSFEGYNLYRLLNEEAAPGAQTYALQWHCQAPQQLARFLEDHAIVLQQEMMARFGTKCVAFSTVLEKIR